MWRSLPEVAAFLNRSVGYAHEAGDPHLQRYYYMHASLYLWEAVHAAKHRSVRFYWRLVFASSPRLAASPPISPHCLLSAPHLAPSSQPTSSRHRLETDALFSGSYGALLASTGGSDADLVLHKYSTEKRTGWYPHWNNNRELLADVPARYA